MRQLWPVLDTRGRLTTPSDSLRRSGIFIKEFTRSNPMGAASAAVLVALGLVAIFAGQLAPYDPILNNYDLIKQPPSSQNLLGTDHLGRDLLSRLIHGTRVSLLVAFSSVAASKTVGLSWGILTGYIGGTFDLLSQRLIDVLMSFPGLILALLLLAALGSGVDTVIIAISVGGVAGTTRVIRSVVLSIRETSYVDAARAIGASPLRVMVQHVGPQCVAPLLVLASISLGGAIFAEASLSFLGLGIPPPHPSWGNVMGGILAEAFRPPWWLLLLPGMVVTVAVLAFNLFGDALRDHLDPKLRGRLQ